MKFALRAAGALALSLLQVHAAQAAKDDVQVRAFVNDSCIIADEPYFIPQSAAANSPDQTAKFLPLLGIVVGKLTELFIKHEIDAQANRLKAHAERKDTHYAMTRQMNLYRADFDPVPAVNINARLGCMTIVAADFLPEPAQCSSSYLPKELARESMSLPQSQWRTSRTDDTVENQLRRADVCVKNKVRAVYEARFEFSEDGTAYRLKDAGYRIDSLLTTDDKHATRTALYTLKISNPGATEQQEVLSSAWVGIGAVSPGARSSGSGGENAPWLRVPPLSVEARRVYEEKTKAQQEVMGEIAALKRAMVRNQRMLTGMDQKIAAAGGDLAEGLKQERTKIAVSYEAQMVELEARNAEYRDLPRQPLEFMPVKIEVAVTETESEKKAQLAVADLIGDNAGQVASAVANAASGLVSRSLRTSDLVTDSAADNYPNELERTRAHYYDALTEARTTPSGGAAEAQQRLTAAKSAYNSARRSLGLTQID